MAVSINLSLTWLVLITTTVALLIIISSPPSTVAELNCATVINALIPCYHYVVGNGQDVPAPCCGGLKYLVSWDYNREDVQVACSCLEGVFGDVGDQELNRAMDIPWKCGVNLGFQIGGDMNCDTIRSKY